MNSTIMRKVTVTAEYQPLSAQRLVGSFEISSVPTNVSVVLFRGDDGSDVPWVPGEFHCFQRVDLARVFVKGAIGDAVTIIGGTW